MKISECCNVCKRKETGKKLCLKTVKKSNREFLSVGEVIKTQQQDSVKLLFTNFFSLFENLLEISLEFFLLALALPQYSSSTLRSKEVLDLAGRVGGYTLALKLIFCV